MLLSTLPCLPSSILNTSAKVILLKCKSSHVTPLLNPPVIFHGFHSHSKCVHKSTPILIPYLLPTLYLSLSLFALATLATLLFLAHTKVCFGTFVIILYFIQSWYFTFFKFLFRCQCISILGDTFLD